MYKHEQGIPMKIGNNRPLHGSVLAGVVSVLLLAGCQRESEPAPATDAAPAAEAPVKAPTKAPAKPAAKKAAAKPVAKTAARSTTKEAAPKAAKTASKTSKTK